MIRQANGEAKRKYAAVEQFNTSVDKIFTVGGHITLVTAGTTQSNTVPLPCTINQDGTYIAAEIVGLDINYYSCPTSADNWQEFVSLYVPEGKALADRCEHSRASDANNLYYNFRAPYVLTSVGAILFETMDKIDLTHAGKGITVVSDLEIAYDTLNYAGNPRLDYKVYYKQVMLTTPAYVAIKK